MMRVPPPLLFVAAFAVGAGLQHLARLTFPPVPGMHVGGWALIGGAVLLALYSLGTFLVARTTIVPFSAASKLVTWGPYRFTRNPMYVSLVFAYLGVAAILSQLGALIFLLAPLIVVRAIVIPFEEERMREVFGEAYDQYCSKVHRWL